MADGAAASAVVAPKPDVHQALKALGDAFVMLGNAIKAIPEGSVDAPAPAKVKKEPKVKKEKKEKKKKEKRAPSAYNLFVRENSSKLRASGKYETQQEVMQALGAAWKALSPAGRAVWDAKAKVLAGNAVDDTQPDDVAEEHSDDDDDDDDEEVSVPPPAPTPSSSKAKRKSVEVPEPEPVSEKKKKKKKASDDADPAENADHDEDASAEKKKKKKKKSTAD